MTRYTKYTVFIQILFVAVLLSCSKIAEVTPSLREPSALPKNSMEIKYNGYQLLLTNRYGWFSNKITNFSGDKKVAIFAHDDVKTSFNETLGIGFEFWLPIPSSKKYAYIKSLDDISNEQLAYVVYYSDVNVGTKNRKILNSGSLTVANGELEITDFKENQYIQGKFYFNLKDSSNSAEIEGTFNLTF